jgi:short-subunit dehydrogenase
MTLLQRYGPTALVTGASSGIGAAMAVQLATRGFDVVLTARRQDRLAALAAQLKDRHAIDAKYFVCDLSKPEQVDALITHLAEVDLGLVISNAGFGFKGRFDDAPLALQQEMLMVNTMAPLTLCRALLPSLVSRGRGGVILTGSVEGFVGCPYSTTYAASKAFIQSFGEGLWAEYRPLGVDILTLCPGATDTEAPRKQGIDPAALPHLMSAEEVAERALEQLGNGPVYVPSAHYREMFEQLQSLPREQALLSMAENLKP